MVSDVSAIGRTGVLTVATRGQSGPGEALVGVRGGSETFLAWSDDPLPLGVTVLVVECRGPRTVGVVAWPDPTDMPSC